MKYFSKLLSMLLVGAMLFTVGCTDYDEDIKNLKQEVNDIVETLYNDEINPLKADLADTKANLEQLKQDLEDALAALEAEHDKDIEALKADLESKIAEANQKILDLEGALADEVAAREAAITALTNQLNEAKTELQGKIDAEATARANGDKALADDLAQEIQDRKDAISALETKLQGEIDALESSMNGNIQDLREEMNEAIEDANEAIENAVATLNNKIDGEIAARQQAIAGLEQQIANAQSDLQGKIDAEATARANGDQELAEKIAKEIQDRQAAISALETKLAEEVKKLEEAYKAADAELQKKIDETNLALAAEKTERENADKALQAAIDAEAEARKAGDAELAAKYEDLAKRLEDEIAARKAAIKALEDELAALKNINGAQHAEYEKQIAALQAGLERAEKEANAKFEALESSIAALKAELEKQIADNKAAIAGNTSAINNLNGQVANLNNVVKNLQDTATQTLSMLMNHIGEFYSFKASVDGQLAALKAKDNQLEAAIEEINEQIDALTVQIETNAGLIEQNVLDIAANTALIEEVKKAAEDTFAVLMAADQALWNAINTLSATTDAEFAAVRHEATVAQAELRNELEMSFAALSNEIAAVRRGYEQGDIALLEEITKVYNELTQCLAEEAAKREAADMAMSEAFNSFKANAEMRLAELEAAVDSIKKEFAAYRTQVNALFDAVYVAIGEAMDTAIRECKNYTNAKIDELYAKVTEDIAAESKKINERIDAVVKAYEDADKLINDRITTEVGNLQKQIDTILSRIQSVVFVPEYSDGKGTINWAWAKGTIVEGRSTMTYAVYPADCALALAEAWKLKPEVLTFDVKALKDPATRGSNYVFNIVNVLPHDGYIDVIFEARNLSDAFYYSRMQYDQPMVYNKELEEDRVMEYAASLVIDTDNENLSSCFTNVVPATPEEISMIIVTPDVDGKEVDITGEIVEPALKIEYIDTKTIVTILEDHKVKFTVGGKAYYGIEALNAAGYALELDVEPYAGSDDATSIDPFKLVGANEDGTNEDGILEVSVAKVDEALIDLPVVFGYNYTAGGLTATAGREVVTTPITAKLTFDPVEVTWTYVKDAPVDAAFFADKTQTAVVYERDQLPLKAIEDTLPEDTTIEDVLSTLPTEVVVNDTVLKDDSTLKLGFNADGELAVLAIRGFAFEGEPTYNIVATYELHNVVVTVKATVVTKDRNRDKVNVTIQESITDVCKNLELTMRDPFAHVYDEVVKAGTNMGEGIDAKIWMTENFITKVPVAVPTIAGLNCSTWKYAYFKVYDWEHIDAVYSYRTSNYLYENAGWTIPTDLNYECEFTTWYGQVIKVSKVLKFNLPKFDFAHNEYYVFEDDTRFYSQVAPEYTFNPEGSDAIETYTVANVELKNAFLVIDENNQILDKALMDKYGLVVEYIIEDEKHPGIEMVNGNEIVYLGSMDEVNVYGYLYIQNSDSAKTRIQLPTSFDNNDAYGDYVVKKFNPIMKPVITECHVNVNNDKPFTVNPLNYISLGDDRRGAAAINKPSYDLIDTKLGAWVMGNGENGFAVDRSTNEVYGLDIKWSWSEASVPAQLKDQFVWNEDNTLTFKNTNNMALTKDVKLSITLTIENVWMEPQEIKVPVTFHPAQGFTPAE